MKEKITQSLGKIFAIGACFGYISDLAAVTGLVQAADSKLSVQEGSRSFSPIINPTNPSTLQSIQTSAQQVPTSTTSGSSNATGSTIDPKVQAMMDAINKIIAQQNAQQQNAFKFFSIWSSAK